MSDVHHHGGVAWAFAKESVTLAKAYLTKLLGNVRVVRWLAQNKAEYLSEFQAIAELTSLPSEPLAVVAE